jgi:hypothetical protein
MSYSACQIGPMYPFAWGPVGRPLSGAATLLPSHAMQGNMTHLVEGCSALGPAGSVRLRSGGKSKRALIQLLKTFLCCHS